MTKIFSHSKECKERKDKKRDASKRRDEIERVRLIPIAPVTKNVHVKKATSRPGLKIKCCVLAKWHIHSV